MAAVSEWRESVQLDGPFAITASDVAEVNRVFSDAFTDRYHRDGLVGVRVPFLSQAVWNYAIADADGGAMLWRGSDGQVVAFNIAHISGIEGWMGPLAVANSHQGGGAGKTVVRTAVEWLKSRGARVIGLETMPRTMDNIGFYSQLGFEPGKLTLTVTIDALPVDTPLLMFSRLTPSEQDDQVAECSALAHLLLPGYDFRREMRLTEDLRLGDTLLLRSAGALQGFAICHSAPLVEGRTREELRVLKLVSASNDHLRPMIRGIADLARRSGARRASIRVQSDYLALYRTLILMGGRVRWSDLRMTAPGYREVMSESGVVLSNWEI
jgi:GNAT superfamily N-acetyltransferase